MLTLDETVSYLHSCVVRLTEWFIIVNDFVGAVLQLSGLYIGLFALNVTRTVRFLFVYVRGSVEKFAER